MSAILAIMLMLMSGVAVFTPHVSAAPAPAAFVTCNLDTMTGATPVVPPNVTLNAATWPKAKLFNVSIDVGPVTGLLTEQVGFYFNQTVLQVQNTFFGNWLNGVPLAHRSTIPASWDNSLGTCDAELMSALGSSYAVTITTNATLMIVEFMINPALAYPPSATQIVSAIHLVTTNLDTRQLILTYQDGSTDLTPIDANIHSCYLTLSVPAPTPHGPTASFTWTPTLVYVGTTVNFDGSASTGGSNGIVNYPLVTYAWTFGDSNTGSGVTTTHAYSAAGTYSVTLLVTDSNGEIANQIQPITVYAAVTGCNIDLYTQGWRYIDPFYIDVSQFTGLGPNFTTALFRPGDYVQLYANVTYNGAPVAGQLVSFEVNNTQGAILVGTAISQGNGIAEYDFRVPWPSTPYINYPNGTEFLPEFGNWIACATWQCGSITGVNGTQPFEKTQIDTMKFEVSWGMWVTGVSTTAGTYIRGTGMASVKLTVQNDYPVAVTALATADIYDNLLVPIDGPAYAMYVFPANSHTDVTLGPITIENWAFVGIATVKGNLFSTWPWLDGTSYCPEVVSTFSITLH